jgi:hypothetical protein
MFGTFRKHSQLLWWVIIGGTIVSFVIFFNPTSKYGGGGGGGGEARTSDTGASIEGRPITAEEFIDAKREELLFYFLQHGEWATEQKLQQQNYQLDQRAYQRVALNQKAKELGINPTAKAAARMVEEMFGAKAGETVTAETLVRFEQQNLAPNHLTLEDFTRFAMHQAANQQLVSLFGMSGKLITPKEAEAFYVRENEPTVAQIAYFPLSNYMSQVNVTLQQATNFFKTNEANYWLPERVQIQYVKFPMSNYVAAADKDIASNTNLSKEIDAYYLQRDPKSFIDTNKQIMTPEAAKAKIKADLRDNRALTFARTNANALIQDLITGHDDEHPFTLDDLQKVASAKGLKVNVTEPFDGRTGPKEFKPTQAFMRTAFSLSTNAPEDKSRSMTYAQSPIPIEDGWLVMGLKARFDAKHQDFAQVQAKVIDDMKQQQAFMMARSNGLAFEAKAMTAMNQGKGFDSVASANKVGLVTLPAFSLTGATNLQSEAELKKMETVSPNVAHLLVDRNEFQQLVENVYTLQTGKISPYIPTMQGGYIVYLKARQPVDSEKLQKELPTYLARLRDQRANAAFAEWFQKQAQEMRLSIPQPQQRSPNAG